MFILQTLSLLLRGLLGGRMAVAAEILALRHQLAVYHRTVYRPQLRRRDRVFWIVCSRMWKGWREVLVIVKPETMIKWHRQGFQLYWRWKSKARVCGRPQIDKEIRHLIRRMSAENPLWGVPRMQAELHLLGYDVAGVDCREVPSEKHQASITDVEELSE